jgi:nicotinamide phosphoribosyltransferase
MRDVVERAFDRTSDGGRHTPLVSSRLHDFGFRGCTCVEQSVVGGCAHLLSFVGTDTLSAAFYAQVRVTYSLAPFLLDKDSDHTLDAGALRA